MADFLVEEFEMWLANLKDSVKKVSENLEEQPVNTEVLHTNYDNMLVDLEQLRTFRPTKKNTPYEYKEALPTIAAALRLQPRVRRQLHNRLDPLAASMSGSTEQIQQTAATAQRRIPELSIIPFTGDVTTYASFIKSFHLKFDELPITAAEKLQHLKSNLRGDPFKIVGNLELTDENYTVALTNLQQKYDSKQMVVSELYYKIQALPLAQNTAASLRTVYYELEGYLSALKAHGQDVDLVPPLRDQILCKYPLFITQQVCGTKIPTLTEFQEAMAQYIQMRVGIQAAAEATGTYQRRTDQVNSSKKPFHAATSALVASSLPLESEKDNTKKQNNTTASTSSPLPKCVFCSEKHYSATCTKYTKLVDRLPFLKERCHRCLGKNHEASTCSRSISCRFCKKKEEHNSALCPDQFGSKQPNVITSPRGVHFVKRSRGAHNTMMVNAFNHRTKQHQPLRVFLDMGSNDSYITEHAAKKLELTLSKFQQTSITVFGNQKLTISSASTAFEITNAKGFNLVIEADTTPSAPDNVRIFDYDEFKTQYPDLSSTPFVDTGVQHPIDVVLGNDYVFDIILPETKIIVEDGLYLVNTEFGWILTGRQCSRDNSENRMTLLAISPATALNQLCSLDVIGINELPLSQINEEQNALNEFYANLTFVDNRYQIRWPWRSFPPPIVNNFGLAIGRLRTQLRRLNKDLFHSYDSILQQQLRSGIIEEVPEAVQMEQSAYYLPHHPVFTPEKSTPLRIVYDGSARPAKNLNSINDAIYKGRNLLTDLTAILMRFRLRRIAMVSDIEKCYLQLSIHPQDRDYVRFIWIRNPEAPPSGRNLRIFRFTRVAFGIVASPFLSNAVIYHHLQQNRNDYFSFKDIYVDNLITGTSNPDEAQDLYTTGVSTFRKCSMNLRSWATNSPTVRDFFPSHHVQKAEEISVLGITWNQYHDTLSVKRISREAKTTLRTILCSSSTFYDPCGWYSPISIRAKILMQDLRTANYNWDDELPTTFEDKWTELRSDFDAASDFKLPRFQIDLKQTQTHQLHCFVDASARAYACAVYLRTQVQDDAVQVHLLFSKARIAPKQTECTIPRLELFAALLGSKALKFIMNELPVTIEHMILWSDSKCVIHWINSQKILPGFIQRRVDEIRNTPHIQVRYVPTELNPADHPSRGVSFETLQSSWWCGPKYLQSSSENWPLSVEIQPMNDALQLEHEHSDRVTLTASSTGNYAPFEVPDHCRNSYRKLMRVTMFAVKFLRGFAVIKRRNLFEPEHTSRLIAQHLWVKAEQSNHLQDIRKSLMNEPDKKKHNLIQQLRLELDDAGIIRCAGRLTFAPLSNDEKRPLLLPTASFLTRLIIIDCHKRHFHTGTSHTLAALRQTFWVPRGRAAVYHTIKRCVKCKRFTARPYCQPKNSNLPEFRLERTEFPFTNIGVDVFGHLWVGRQKRYVLIVVDLVVRAIDLELLRNMTAEEIALAFRNIAAGHTQPQFVISDNAPQFELLKQNLQNEYTHELKWKFIPEKASWMAGAYERLIALVKNSLLRTFHGQPLTDSKLRTALAEIAGVLNSRPLTYVAADPEMIPLTPNDFLRSHLNFDQREQPLHTAGTPTASQLVHIWKRNTELRNKFWSVWKTHYLQYLRERTQKTQFSQRPALASPDVGEVVLVAEPNIKRANWKLGRIIALNRSQDQQIRSATIKMGNKRTIIRPLTVLYPLELDDGVRASPTLENISQVPDQSGESTEDEEVIEYNLDFDF